MNGEESRKILDAWLPPDGAGAPLGCIATTYTFEPNLFDEHCLPRFLGLETAGTDETGDDNFHRFEIERDTKLLECRATVIVDRQQASPSPSYFWDVVPTVTGRKRGIQHSKVSLLVWENVIRLIVASANLTSPGFRKNLEVFSVLDEDDERIPNRVFEDGVDFLDQLINDWTAGDDSPTGPRGRARQTIENARNRIAERTNPRAVPGLAIAFLHTGEPTNLIEEAFQSVWDDRIVARCCQVVSPFFDEHGEALEMLVKGLESPMAHRRPREIEFVLDAGEEGGHQIAVNAPMALADIDTREETVTLSALAKTGDESRRPLHAKLFRFSNSKRDFQMTIAGSANATSAGLGLGQRANVEAVIAIGSNLRNPTGRELAASFPQATDLPEGQLIFEASADGEGDHRPSLPEGFIEALFDPEVPSVVVTLEPGSLPKTWQLNAGEGKWFSSRQKIPKGAVLVRSLAGDEEPPRSLTAVWRDEASGEEQIAELPVSVTSPASLPEPGEIRDLTIDELLDFLAAGGAFGLRVADLVLQRSQAKERKAGAVDNVPVLDPHARVDQSGFILQRTRRASRGLEGLARRLAEPVHTSDALDRRLNGNYGPRRLAELLEGQVEAGGMAQSERAFLLAEIALVVRRTKWEVSGVALTEKECEKQARNAIEELDPGATGDARIDEYVEAAFRGPLR